MGGDRQFWSRLPRRARAAACDKTVNPDGFRAEVDSADFGRVPMTSHRFYGKIGFPRMTRAKVWGVHSRSGVEDRSASLTRSGVGQRDALQNWEESENRKVKARRQ